MCCSFLKNCTITLVFLKIYVILNWIRFFNYKESYPQFLSSNKLNPYWSEPIEGCPPGTRARRARGCQSRSSCWHPRVGGALAAVGRNDAFGALPQRAAAAGSPRGVRLRKASAGASSSGSGQRSARRASAASRPLTPAARGERIDH